MERPVNILLPQVMVCLLLQGGIVGGGVLLRHYVALSQSCCDRHLEL